jgi:hypothetical protein
MFAMVWSSESTIERADEAHLSVLELVPEGI